MAAAEVDGGRRAEVDEACNSDTCHSSAEVDDTDGEGPADGEGGALWLRETSGRGTGASAMSQARRKLAASGRRDSR